MAARPVAKVAGRVVVEREGGGGEGGGDGGGGDGGGNGGGGEGGGDGGGGGGGDGGAQLEVSVVCVPTAHVYIRRDTRKLSWFVGER